MENRERIGLEDIQIPQGLESRLTAKIDLWAKAEQEERVRVSMRRPYNNYRKHLWQRASAAAVVAVMIIAVSMIIKPRNKALTDTYDDSGLAYLETVNALNILSETLSMGKDKIESLDVIVSASDNTFKTISE